MHCISAEWDTWSSAYDIIFARLQARIRRSVRRYASGVIAAEGAGNDERLRRIEAVTDITLSRLDADDLFDELLERVRDLLRVDTAAIMLLEPNAEHLLTTAAKGLEEEIRQGIRLPVGYGFTGRVARDKRPVIITDVDPHDVLSSELREAGVRSLLGVPVLSGDEVVGVLYVGSLTRREFSPADIHLLQLVGDRAAVAGRTRLSRMDRSAALALQRSLLPARLPDIAGVELAARYVPGHRTGVGGDWYDVFTLPSGVIGIVVGDVSGHGLAAAVVMGRLRSALRAYALECDDPADALTRLDHKIRHFETGNLATALYAMIDPSRDRLRISLAGHLPPILASPGKPAESLALPVDLPLGTGHEQPRHTTEVALDEGAVIVAYTDGLVERRDESIDIGMQRLIESIEPAPAEVLCAAIMADLGAALPTDDIALLTLRRHTGF